MRQYKVIKKKGGLDKGVVIGDFLAHEDMSTLAFARVFRDYVVGMAGYDAWHGYSAVPLCRDCGEMLFGEIIVAGLEDRDLSICDKCWYRKDTRGLDTEYADISCADERIVG